MASPPTPQYNPQLARAYQQQLSSRNNPVPQSSADPRLLTSNENEVNPYELYQQMSADNTSQGASAEEARGQMQSNPAIALLGGTLSLVGKLVTDFVSLPFDMSTVPRRAGLKVRSDVGISEYANMARRSLRRSLMSAGADIILRTAYSGGVTAPIMNAAVYTGTMYPLYVIRNRAIVAVMCENPPETIDLLHSSLLDDMPLACAESIIKHENAAALYRGLTPHLISSAFSLVEPYESLEGMLVYMAFSTLLAYPFETVSIRMQMDPLAKRYPAMWRCMYSIISEEGTGALYAGLGTDILRGFCVGVAQFTVNFGISALVSTMFS